MRFRPCIDIHNGKVKQIVGGSLQDTGNQAAVNFASEQEADYYARLYKEDGLIRRACDPVESAHFFLLYGD